MKKIIISSLILLIPFFGFSQINQSLDLVSGIEYSFRNLTNSTSIGLKEARNLHESGKYNWRIGFNHNLRLSDKLFLKTGLRIASVGYNEDNGLHWSSGHVSLFQRAHNYWFTSIPIAARFELNQKKISPFFEVGLSPSFLISKRIKLLVDSETTSEGLERVNQDFERLHLISFISSGLNYALNDNYQFYGQAIFRYHLTKLEDGNINEHLYNYGLELGLRRKLK